MRIPNQLQSLHDGAVTSVDLVKAALKHTNETKEYNAVLRTREAAVHEAQKSDERRKSGKQIGRLEGIPFMVKDNFLTVGDETTAGSNMLKGFIAPYTATAVQKILDEGAVLVGKTNLDCYGFGSSTENSDFGPTKNPHDAAYVPGGSSGGSAAAVALGLVPFALGTDTGGSIRQPASFTGTVGYKPTYGLVSRYGMTAMASSTDTVGVLANTASDAALVMDIMAGRDTLDSTTINKPDTSLAIEPSELKNKRFGLIEEWMTEDVDSEVRMQVEKAAEKIVAAGGVVKDLSIPQLDYALSAYYIIVPAEISSNMSRYDGIRYQYSANDTATLEARYLQSRSKGLNAEAKRRILMGTYVLSSGYYDAYYKKAQQVRTLLIQAMSASFEGVDYLLGPTAPSPPFKIGAKVDDPITMYLSDVMTVPSSLCGTPSVSLPVAKSGKLPIGMQVLAPQAKDKDLLGIAQSIEAIVGYSA